VAERERWCGESDAVAREANTAGRRLRFVFTKWNTHTSQRHYSSAAAYVLPRHYSSAAAYVLPALW
jgi:hypothetical protein